MLEFVVVGKSLRIIFMGTPDFAVPSLVCLFQSGYEVVAVYTQPDKPAGRGLSLISSPVKKKAQSLGLKVIQPKSLRFVATQAELAAFKPDAIVVAAYAKLLSPTVLEMPKFGALNVHPSLLPRHRGAAPVASAILAGDEMSGVSIMLMDKGLDTGPVLAECPVPIAAEDTTFSLTEKLAVAGAHLLSDVLPRWISGEITPKPQDESLATYSSPISREDGEIDWHLTALELSRRVRAYEPWPGAYTRWRGKKLKVISAKPLPKRGTSEMGRVVALKELPNFPFGVVTGDGILGVSSLQLEGRRALLAVEFLRGQRDFIGSILPS